jgi:hypothetical protein
MHYINVLVSPTYIDYLHYVRGKEFAALLLVEACFLLPFSEIGNTDVTLQPAEHIPMFQ